jgi:hypothetical protein
MRRLYLRRWGGFAGAHNECNEYYELFFAPVPFCVKPSTDKTQTEKEKTLL